MSLLLLAYRQLLNRHPVSARRLHEADVGELLCSPGPCALRWPDLATDLATFLLRKRN